MAHQHCRLSISDAIADYAHGLLTAKGAIAYWIKIHLAPGWKRKINPKEIRETFKRKGKAMARSTFWDALHSLQEVGLINFEEPESLTVTRIETDGPENRTASEIPNDGPENRTTARKTGRPSGIPNEQPPEPTAGMGFGNRPYSSHISSNSSQIEREGGGKFSRISEEAIQEYEQHLNSLPADQAERFKKFLISRAKSLPKPPAIQIKWAASNWKYLWKEFEQDQQSPTVATPSGFSVEEVRSRSPEVDQPQALQNIRAILGLAQGGHHVATV